MESQICIGGVEMPSPRFCIGDWVVDLFYCPYEQRLFWTRGLVIGLQLKGRYWNVADTWIYTVLVCQSSDGVSPWFDTRDEQRESELRISRKDRPVSDGLSKDNLRRRRERLCQRREFSPELFPLVPLANYTGLLLTAQPVINAASEVWS